VHHHVVVVRQDLDEVLPAETGGGGIAFDFPEDLELQVETSGRLDTHRRLLFRRGSRRGHVGSILSFRTRWRHEAAAVMERHNTRASTLLHSTVSTARSLNNHGALDQAAHDSAANIIFEASLIRRVEPRHVEAAADVTVKIRHDVSRQTSEAA
jgi:hypothetical protein